jgi:hypothetical protein
MLRESQHDRKTFDDFKTHPVRPEHYPRATPEFFSLLVHIRNRPFF